MRLRRADHYTLYRTTRNLPLRDPGARSAEGPERSDGSVAPPHPEASVVRARA